MADRFHNLGVLILLVFWALPVLAILGLLYSISLIIAIVLDITLWLFVGDFWLLPRVESFRNVLLTFAVGWIPQFRGNMTDWNEGPSGTDDGSW